MRKNKVTALPAAAAGKKKRGVIRRLLSYCRPYVPEIVGALVCSVIHVVATLLVPVIIGDAVDQIVGAGQVDFEAVLFRIGLLAIAVGAAVVSQGAVGLLTNRISYGVVRDVRSDAFAKLTRLPLSYIDTHSHGDIMARITSDVEQLSDGLIQGFTQIFAGATTIAGTIGFMLAMNVPLSLIVIILTPVSVAVSYFIAKGCHKSFTEQAELRGQMTGLTSEMLTDVKTVKAFSYEKKAEERFGVINKKVQKVGTRAMFYSALVNPTARLVSGIVYAAVCIVGAYFCVDKSLTVGQLSAFLAYANQYAKPFNEITGVVTELASAAAAGARVFRLIDAEEEKEKVGALDSFSANGDVSVDKLFFSYTGEPLIENFTLDVKKGQRIAIVGPTGSGKTTIINLLMRFYEPDGGAVYLDGTAIDGITRKALRKNMGMVLQETWLTEGTIRDNIAYGKPDATMDEIIEAAKSARIHKFITRQPEGYDTVLLEGGANISEGQRQLLCIARIMLLRPPVLILDEATSNIDARTEARVQRAFKSLMEGRTVFIVAHRLATIQGSDVILVMDGGKIAQQGTHESLMQSGGLYKEMYEAGLS